MLLKKKVKKIYQPGCTTVIVKNIWEQQNILKSVGLLYWKWYENVKKNVWMHILP